MKKKESLINSKNLDSKLKEWDGVGLNQGLTKATTNLCDFNTTTGSLTAGNCTFTIPTGLAPLNVVTDIHTPLTYPDNNLTWIVDDNPPYIPYLKPIPENKNEMILDFLKKVVKIFDFTNILTEYSLIGFKKVKILNEEFDAITIERELLPGELKQLVDNRKGEILVEFIDIPENRYGEDLVPYDERKGNLYQKIFVDAISGMNYLPYQPFLLGNEVIAVQPMNPPNIELNYTDFIYQTSNSHTVTCGDAIGQLNPQLHVTNQTITY